MITLLTLAPVKLATSSMALTVPATEECTGAETKASVDPISWPTATLSPTFTTGELGAPMCCCRGMTTSAGTGASTMALPAASSLL